MSKLSIFVCLSFVMVFGQNQGTPSSFKVATFAIKDYENSWQSQLPRSLANANALYNSFASNLQSKYPSTTYSRLKRENAAVTRTDFLS